MNIELFQHEHVDILKIVKDIEYKCHNGIADSRKELARDLMMLRFKVKVHLSAEDKLLYTAIPEEVVKAANLAHGYRDEMLGISTLFLDYISRWEWAEKIGDEPALFNKETQGIVEALRHRIQRENNELYPILNKAYLEYDPMGKLIAESRRLKKT